MTPDDRRHGTYAGAQQHRRDGCEMCAACHKAFRKYQSHADYDRKRGLSRRVPTGPVGDHLRGLLAAGMTVPSIAKASGVARATIQDAMTRPRPYMLKDNADALLAIQPQPVPTGTVPSIGTIRRIQALGRIGWSTTDIARRTQAITGQGLRQLLSDSPPVVKVPTAEAVSAVYDQLSMRLPPAGRHASQVRNRAASKGWPPPLAWDNPDDPSEMPKLPTHHERRGKKPRGSLLENWRWLREGGVPIEEAARRLGVTVDAIEKAEERAKEKAA